VSYEHTHPFTETYFLNQPHVALMTEGEGGRSLV